jgi:two-component system osmolarity sensor histidine kinase EnvZ
MDLRLKTLLPRSLYGRAALILIVPIVTIQLVVSIAFIQRHYERVTRQMSGGLAIELQMIRDRAGSAAEVADLATGLGFLQRPAAEWRQNSLTHAPYDLPARAVVETLQAALPELAGIDLVTEPDEVRVLMQTRAGPAYLVVDRKRVAATNPHQLLVVMLLTSVLMTVIAFIFLRNQLRPIRRLALAAEGFGKGQHIPYRPSGASEVRAAGSAFLDMRGRIERQIEQRTLMLSGVSHDLRSPLTRLRLGLSMLPEDEDTRALLGDVADMERLVDEFLSFARGDAMEEPVETDLVALVRHAVDNAQRAGQAVDLAEVEPVPPLRLRPAAIGRALDNLIGNAVRHGSRAEVSLRLTDRAVRIAVEDDGPGIPQDRREAAMAPFVRLDSARDPNRGGGVGLGLAIAADIARSHGGSLRIGDSATLGGARVELVLAR